MVVHSIGVSDQSPKECHTSYPAVGVLGIHGRHSINDHCATIPQGGSNSEGSVSIAEATGSADKDASTLHRYPSGDQTSGTIGAPSFSCPSRPENPGPTSQDCHLPIMGADVTRSTERTTMVDNSTAIALLSSNPEYSGISGHRIGRIQIGLGGSLSGSAYWREVDPLRIGLSHQLFGVERSLFGPTSLCEGQEQYWSFDKNGQQNSHSLCEQDGGSHTVAPMSIGITDLGMVSVPEDHPTCGVFTRQGQYRGRLGVLSSSRQQRLAAVTIRLQGPQQGSRSLQCRPICQQDQCSVGAVLQLEARSSSQGGRCFLSLLGTGQTIPVPSFQPHRESLDQDPNGSGRVCLPYSTSVASTSLVSSGAGDVSEGPNSPPNEFRSSQESRPDSAPSRGGGADVLNRMAYLRQGFFMQGFSDRVTSMLLQSWRTHTHSAYNSAWKKWTSWCVAREVNPFSATLADILEFLADNFDLGLQYYTLNTLCSAISTTHSKVDDYSVGKHPLVVRLLKGMFNARLPTPRYNNSWEVTPVVDFLRSLSENLALLQLSKKVVTLMALSNAD